MSQSQKKVPSRLADIAEIAGVSLMTVHRVLHKRSGVAEETKKRILKIAAELNYKPYSVARAMRLGRFNTIGLAMGHADMELSSVVGIFRILNQHNYNLVFSEIPYAAPESSFNVPRILSEKMIDGLILHAGVLRYPKIANYFGNAHLPEVIIIGEDKMNCVAPDYASVMPYCFQKLVDCGYTRLIFVGPVKADSYHYSYMPFHLFDSWKVKKIKKMIVPTDIDIPEEKWQTQLRNLLKSNEKTALVAPSFTEARVCFYFATESGHNIPTDIGILSFTTKREHSDSGILFSGYVYSGFALGEAAATLILERINNKGIDMPSVRIPFKKIEGKTLPKEFFV